MKIIIKLEMVLESDKKEDIPRFYRSGGTKVNAAADHNT